MTSPLPPPNAPRPQQTDAAPAGPRLSAILIVRDESRRLPDCLAALHGLADELVVVDSGSTDDTVAIAAAAGARVTSLPFTGFGHLKQAALDRASGSWILSVDADERVTPELAAEIRQVMQADAAAPVGFWVRRELVYLGRRLHFGGAESDWVLRLARRERAYFTQRAIHERLEVDGTTARLRGTLTHVKYDTLAEHLATIDRYTTLIADERALRGARFSAWHLLRVPWELFARLVLRLGFLDGRAGVIHATMSAFYAFLKYAKLWRHERALRDGTQGAGEETGAARRTRSAAASGDDRRGGCSGDREPAG